jgi:hypothetical protein
MSVHAQWASDFFPLAEKLSGKKSHEFFQRQDWRNLSFSGSQLTARGKKSGLFSAQTCFALAGNSPPEQGAVSAA